ncbi:MAG: MBL fold metallo-hydrolase [Dehalococcoidales bacterium]|nr:MBL fold metallo-hydrolase [Dehalococcoidales bacterium]
MKIKLRFLGGAGNVTGSSYLLEASGKRLLVDCGMFQEWELKGRNWQFSVPPESIDAILLSHAHLDHSGRIPKLVNDGFRGKIYCTGVTVKLAEIMLQDAGNLQEEDALNKKKRHDAEGRKGPHPEIPLYTAKDALKAMPLFVPLKYGEPVEIGDNIKATFHDAGHVLGSAMIKVSVRQGKDERSIIFSGDIGRWNAPILRDPTIFDKADYVLVESTYGNRLHESTKDIQDELAEVILSTIKSGGDIVVPSFALERAQEVLFYLRELRRKKQIPMIMVFMDSPMAISITEVFENHPEYFDKETMDMVHKGLSPFEFPGLKMTRSTEESKAINSIKGTVMIIAGAGMCTGGRVKHHLVANISRPESTILFVGYQASGTLGRQILDGAKEVRIYGQYLPVRARIAYIDGFSAHADKNELLTWLSGLKSPPRRVFVVHGEPEAAGELGSVIRSKMGWNASVPVFMEGVVLD